MISKLLTSTSFLSTAGVAAWLVEVNNSFQIFLVEESKGKVYLDWIRIRIADYIGDKRCHRCQRYGRSDTDCESKGEVQETGSLYKGAGSG